MREGKRDGGDLGVTEDHGPAAAADHGYKDSRGADAWSGCHFLLAQKFTFRNGLPIIFLLLLIREERQAFRHVRVVSVAQLQYTQQRHTGVTAEAIDLIPPFLIPLPHLEQVTWLG